MSSTVKGVFAILTLALVIQVTKACGKDVPCTGRQVAPPASTKNLEPSLPDIPKFCQTGRPEAGTDCACLLLITDRVEVFQQKIFESVCEDIIGRKLILQNGPRGCKRFGIRVNRRLRLRKVLKVIKFVNKLLPFCVPFPVPDIVLKKIIRHRH